MKLNREFVRTIEPPLIAVLPHGEITSIATKLECQQLTVRNAIHGASTNELAIKEALKAILELERKIQAIKSQIPTEVLKTL